MSTQKTHNYLGTISTCGKPICSILSSLVLGPTWQCFRRAECCWAGLAQRQVSSGRRPLPAAWHRSGSARPAGSPHPLYRTCNQACRNSFAGRECISAGGDPARFSACRGWPWRRHLRPSQGPSGLAHSAALLWQPVPACLGRPRIDRRWFVFASDDAKRAQLRDSVVVPNLFRLWLVLFLFACVPRSRRERILLGLVCRRRCLASSLCRNHAEKPNQKNG